MEHGLNYFKWVEGECQWIAWADHDQLSLPCAELYCGQSHKTCIPYVVKLQDGSTPGQFAMQNLTVVPPDSHDGVTSECGLAVPCHLFFFCSWQLANMRAAMPGKFLMLSLWFALAWLRAGTWPSHSWWGKSKKIKGLKQSMGSGYLSCVCSSLSIKSRRSKLTDC